MPRPLVAEVDAGALAHNLAVARGAAAGARVLAVVKADGYGHGLLRVAQALKSADGFAVLHLQDALALRGEGFRQDILLLEGFFDAEELACLADAGIFTAIHQMPQVELLAATPLSRRITVFLKVNSGMNRLGFSVGEVPAVVEALQRSGKVREIVLMSHFATADEPAGVDWQLRRLGGLCAGHFPLSLANSAALLRHPHTAGHWVRPGIMLYGASPFADARAEDLNLLPVMTLKSAVIAEQNLAAGDQVGYGGTFVADRPYRVGVVACGYADGYPRHAGTGTPVLVGGRRSRLLGRVSMDMLCIDLSPFPDTGVGSEVVLWGRGLPVEEVAAAAGTIAYELLTGITRRVPFTVGH